jgi:c-di-GMP-related signal transduction protein
VSAPGTSPPDAGKSPYRAISRFVARQPIFTRDEQVFGYELLFRDGVENCFANPDPEAASRTTLDSSMLLGLDVLVGTRRAFINCTYDVLLKDYITLLPAAQTVVEVLESVKPDALIIAACQRLKEAGYLIALDDFAYEDPREALTDFADIIKVDLKFTNPQRQAELIKRYGPWRCRMLAEKVETKDEFKAAKDAGFVYFQGYFFSHPEILTTHEIPANRLNYIQMLQAVSKEDLDTKEIEKLVKIEASICYRLLRYMNSSAFGFASEIHSVRHALSLMGEREIRRWVRLVATLGAAQQKSSELVLMALGRARFCELLSPKIQHGDSDLFLMGLFSLIDAMLEVPMISVLEKVSVDRETKSVLLGGASHLRPLYQLMLASESGDWEAVSQICPRMNLKETDVAETYFQAMRWAREVGEG